MKNEAAELAAFLAELPDYPDWCTISNPGIGTVNGWGDTPLHVAAVQGRISIMEALVRHGADINARGEEGCTPLHETIEQGHWLAALRLLEMGADPTIKDDDGYTPLELFELLYGDKGAAK